VTTYRFHHVRLEPTPTVRLAWRATCDDCRWRYTHTDRDTVDFERRQHMNATAEVVKP
jgi:hypothetical protein